MLRSRRYLLLAPVLALATAGLVACGSESINLAPEDRQNATIVRGAQIFDQRCAACHSFSFAGAQGSAKIVNEREYKDGPSFDQRAESVEDVLYAIRNGGFSSGPMPQNIVTGEDARAVAEFVAKYSGRRAESAPTPGTAPPAGQQPGGPE